MRSVLLRSIFTTLATVACWQLIVGCLTVSAQQFVPQQPQYSQPLPLPAAAYNAARQDTNQGNPDYYNPNEQNPQSVTDISDSSNAELVYPAYQTQPELFYNYYDSSADSIPAGMYPAPRPTPPLVGHVYYTYQALMPHEYMYAHHREYYNYYGHWHGYGNCNGQGSLNHTMVRYQHGKTRPFYLLHLFRRPTPPAVPCNR